MGPLQPSTSAWSLANGVSWMYQHPAQTVDLSGEIPPYGRLLIFPDAQGPITATPPFQPTSSAGFRAAQDISEGTALLLDRGGPQDTTHSHARGVRIHGTQQLELTCEGSLPPPTARPYQVSLRRTSTGFEANSSARQLRCTSKVSDTTATGASGGRIALQSGPPLVRLSHLRLDGLPTAPPLSSGLLALSTALGAGLGAAIDRFQRHDGASYKTRIGVALTLLIAAPLLTVDLRGTVEDLRLAGVDPELLAASLAPALALGLMGLAAVARAAAGRGRDATPMPRQLASVLLRASLLGLAVAGCCAAGTWAAASGWLFLAALCLASTLALNHSSVKPILINLGSMLLVGVGLSATELGLRSSPLALAWSADRTQHMPTDNKLRRLPARDAPRRIVAMGGSTTGGALGQPGRRDYYPARLSRDLARTHAEVETQVVNAGVAGWTTWQIRQALATKFAALDPDILILYVGYNDAMVKSDRRSNQPGPGGGAAFLSATLAHMRLYQGLRAAVNTGMGRKQGHALTPADSRDNLMAIIAAMQPHKTRLLVVSEATWPPNPGLDDTVAALHQVTEVSPGAQWLSGTSILDDPRDFIDDCHLSAVGHQALADALLDQLNELGWLH